MRRLQTLPLLPRPLVSNADLPEEDQMMNIIKNPSRLTVPIKVVEKPKVEPLPTPDTAAPHETVGDTSDQVKARTGEKPSSDDPKVENATAPTVKLSSNRNEVEPLLETSNLSISDDNQSAPASSPSLKIQESPKALCLPRRTSHESKMETDSEEDELHIDMGSQEGQSSN